MSRQSHTRRPRADDEHSSRPTLLPARQDAPPATGAHAGHDFRNVSVFPEGAPAGSEAALGLPGGPELAGGLPEALQAGVEGLSGLSLEGVRVHYDSPQPAGVQALAYAQGDDIHLGPGQERHLPHEAWHVVQQRQGRVQPTLQAGGRPVNDDGALEAEADAMGARLPAHSEPPSPTRGGGASSTGGGGVLQGKFMHGGIEHDEAAKTPLEIKQMLGGKEGALSDDARKALLAQQAKTVDAALPKGAQADADRRQSDLNTRAESVWKAKGGGNQDAAGQQADWNKATAQRDAQIGDMAKSQWWGRHTDTDASGHDTQITAPAGGGQSDAKGENATTDWQKAEAQFDRDLRNQARAAKPANALGVALSTSSAEVKGVNVDGSESAALKQGRGDIRNPGKLDPARQALLKAQLIDDGRASAVDIAPTDKAKAIKDSPVEALIKSGKDDTSPEVIAARAAKSHTDAVGVLGLGKKSTVAGIDEAKHKTQTQHILEHMELGVNQNKLTEKLKAVGKTPAEIEAALMDMTDPLNPKAKNAVGLETEIDAHNTSQNLAATAASDAAKLATVGSSAVKNAAGAAAAAPIKANVVMPAHFVGRHGAQTTKEDQIMRLAGGIAPDHKPLTALPPQTVAGRASVGNVTVPDYGNGGDDVVGATSRFGSAPAQMFAMEEAFAQAAHTTKTAPTMNVAQDIKNTQETNVVYPDYAPGLGGAALGTSTTKKEWKDTGIGTPSNYSYDRGGRMALDVGPSQITDSKGTRTFGSFSTKNDPVGLGQAFALDKPDLTVPQLTNPALPGVKDGVALPTASVAKRIEAIDQTDSLSGAKVILDEDKKYGGFTPQTAYPLAVATPSMTQGYRTPAKEISEHRTNLLGATSTLSNFVSADVPVPSTLGGSGKTDVELLAESTARIKGAGNEDWDYTANAGAGARTNRPYVK